MQIDWVLRKVQTVSGVVSGAILFTSMLLVTLDVMGRFIFRKPIYGVTEIVTVILPAVIFLAATYSYSVGGLIRVSVITSRFRGPLLAGFEVATLLISICLFGILAWQTGIDALNSWDMKEKFPGLVPVPIYPVKFLISIGSALLFLRITVDLILYVGKSRQRL